MNDKKREKNCAKCNLRKTQELYSGKEFDYRNCPYVCLQNKVDYFNTGFVNNPRSRTRVGVILAK